MVKDNWEDSIYISSDKTTDRTELSAADIANGCTATVNGSDYPNIQFKIYDW